MAENTETIILEINATDALNQIAQMQKEMEMLRAKQKEFTTDSQDYQKLASEIRILNKDQSDLKRALDASVKARKDELDTVTFSNNSIKQNRELLKELTAQYINMKQPNGALTAQIKKLSDTLKEQESVIGDNRRNVGNYSDALKGLMPALTSLPGAAGQAAQAAQTMGTAFTAGAGPIGLVMAAVSALLPILMSFEPIAEAVEVGTKAIGAAFDALISGGNILEAASQTAEYTKQLQDLEEQMEGQKIANAEYDKEIRKLMKSAMDQGKTELERLQIIEQAGQRMREQFEENEALLQENVRVNEEEFMKRKNVTRRELDSILMTEKAFLKKYRDNTAEEYNIIRERVKGRINNQDEDLKKLREYQIEKLNTDQRYNTLEEKINNMRSAVLEQIDAKDTKSREKEAAARQKIREQELKKEQERAEFIKKLQEGLDKKRNEDFIKEEEETKKKNDAINTLTKEQMDEIAAAADDTTAVVGQVLYQAEERRLQAIESDEQAIELMKEFNMTAEDLGKDFIRSGKQNWSEYYQWKKDQEYQSAQAQIDAAVQGMEGVKSVANSLSQISATLFGQSAAGVAFQKIIAGIQIAIDTATAISSVVAGVMKAIAASGNPLGMILAVVQVATGIATVVANMAKASQLLSNAGDAPAAPEAPVFADGGEVVTVGGKRHRDGGTKFVGSDGTRFEAEQGEKIFVMKRTAAANIGRLSAFNQLYGGNAWDNNMTRYAEDGGLVFDGGMTTRSMSQPDLAAQIQQAVANMPAPVVSVKEINTVNTRRTIAQEQAGL